MRQGWRGHTVQNGEVPERIKWRKKKKKKKKKKKEEEQEEEDEKDEEEEQEEEDEEDEEEEQKWRQDAVEWDDSDQNERWTRNNHSGAWLARRIPTWRANNGLARPRPRCLETWQCCTTAARSTWCPNCDTPGGPWEEATSVPRDPNGAGQVW
jgi:hypothetical protein